jgi:hypothetical protein
MDRKLVQKLRAQVEKDLRLDKRKKAITEDIKANKEAMEETRRLLLAQVPVGTPLSNEVVTLVRVAGSVSMVETSKFNIHKLPDRYKIPTVVLNKAKAKADLAAGTKIPGLKLEAGPEGLRVTWVNKPTLSSRVKSAAAT